MKTELKDLKEKKVVLPELLNKVWRRLRQKGRLIRNPEMKKVYANFFKLHEERQTTMLHRVDLYSPGPPITLPSSELLGLIDKYAGKTILDIGCGHGAYGKELIKKGYRYTGVEANEEYVKKSQKYFDTRYMRAEKLDFPGKSFDTILMSEVLEHLPDPYAAMRETARVARKNLIVSVPNIGPMVACVEYNVVMHHFMEATHVNFFTKTMLERFLKRYFPYVKIIEFGQFFNLSGTRLYYHLAGIASFDEIKK